MLTMHLARNGYEVVERQNIDELLGNAIDPIERNETAATVTERLSKIGKLLNADAVITGNLINRHPPRYVPDGKDRLTYEAAVCELSARAFDVRTREVFWTCVVNVVATARTGKQLGILDYIDQACYELTDSFSDPNYNGNGSRVYSGEDILARKH
jgi:putative cofactor-binding repeat protein